MLRRPAKPTDALPGVFARAPKSLPAKRIYTRYGRRARSRHGIGYYIAPIANANPLNIIPARCYAQQHLALRRELPTVPERLRASVLELEPRFLDQQRYDRRPQPGVCLLSIDETGAGGISCHLTISTIKQGSTGTFQGEPSGGGVIYGVVPDGVATVTLYLPTRAVTGHVSGNVYIVRYPGRSLTRLRSQDHLARAERHDHQDHPHSVTNNRSDTTAQAAIRPSKLHGRDNAEAGVWSAADESPSRRTADCAHAV